MKVQQNQSLAHYTSFQTGGPAAKLVVIEQNSELHQALKSYEQPLWILGTGANSLVSDKGLSGTTLLLATKHIEVQEEGELLFIADAGVKWDDLVIAAMQRDAWGLECTSGVPGSVGAAVVGNIAAYGQAVADTLAWVDVVSTTGDTQTVERLEARELGLKYRYSDFQNDKLNRYVIVRAAFKLSHVPSRELTYASALKVAQELGLHPDNLEHIRTIILEARRRAGSLLEAGDNNRTAGSFFRNPLVTREQAEQIIKHEENNISIEQILAQNAAHSGDSLRVSAAHVLLAAGFQRGQAWGAVRLHPEHVLKIENTGGATSQDIYNVAQEIIRTVKEKLGINLEPEVRFLGDFS